MPADYIRRQTSKKCRTLHHRHLQLKQFEDKRLSANSKALTESKSVEKGINARPDVGRETQPRLLRVQEATL